MTDEDNFESDIKVGDLFYTSWGYDQTNYDFIIVDRISPTRKTAICRRAHYEILGSGSSGTYDIQKPIHKGFGKSFKMRIEYYQDKIRLRGSYIFCGGEDSESKRLDTFRKVEPNQKFYETNPQFGH